MANDNKEQKPNAQKASIGRIVHYVMNEGNLRGAHRPAVISAVQEASVNLNVFVDGANDGISPCPMWRINVHHSDGNEPGTWHWPERE